VNSEILLTLLALLAGILGWEVIQQHRLTQREREMWDDAERAKGEAEKKRIEDEHKSSTGKSGSNWFSDWLASKRRDGK
jgi:hypothetical protein